VDTGAGAFAVLSPDRQMVIAEAIAFAFRLAFVILPLFTGIGVVLALTNPSRRI
jgi:hypothetical protein